MELVYLWVKEYKNIEEEGFNFSPRFRCEYNLSSNCINIEKKEALSLFDDDINVTAIVGKNGSGKTGLLESLMITLYGMKEKLEEKSNLKFIAVFEKEGFHCYLSPMVNYRNNKTFSLKNFYSNENICFKEIDLNEYFSLHYNFSIDKLSSKFNKLTHDRNFEDVIYNHETTPRSINLFSYPNKNKSFIDIKKLHRESQKYMTSLSKYYNIDELKNIMNETFEENSNVKFIPFKFKLMFDYKHYVESFSSSQVREVVDNYFSDTYTQEINIEILVKYSIVFFIFRSYELFSMSKDSFILSDKYIKNKVFLSILNSIEGFEINIFKSKLELKDKNIKEFMDNIIERFNHDILNNINSIQEDVLGKEIYSIYYPLFEVAWYLDYIRGNIAGLRKQNLELFNSESLIDRTLIEELIQNLPSFIEIEFWNEENVYYDDLSYGEKILNSFFYNFFFMINFANSKGFKHYILLLDEIELGLHPLWQKKFFSLIYKIVEVIKLKFEDISINLILSSHSTFILSDLPKQNIIFLKDGEQVDGLEKKETFGANIHTLLSDSFFMDNGLMGEFAKSKIEQVYEFLVNENKEDIKSKKEAQEIINIIGEPLIKKQLQKLYDETFVLNDLSLDQEIELLEEKLNKLKRLKDDTDKEK